MTTDSDWLERSACRQVADPTWFFPEQGDISFQRAIEYCAKCPVTRECLVMRLADPDLGNDDGIWGGTTAKDRRELRTVLRTDKRQMRKGEAQSDRVAVLVEIHQAALEFGATYRSPSTDYEYLGGHIREGYRQFNRALRVLADTSGIVTPPSRRSRRSR